MNPVKNNIFNPLKIVITVVVITIIQLYFISYGFNVIPLSSGDSTIYYDWVLRGLLEGRLDIPYEAIRTEAFLIAGRYYGYFGPAPAIFRIPEIFFSSQYGKFGGISILISMWIFSIFSLKTLKISLDKNIDLSNNLKVFYLLFITLGTPIIFLCSFISIYHEALAWGLAFASLAYYFLIKYSYCKNISYIPIIAIFSLMAYWSRPPNGIGPIISMLLISIYLFYNKKDGWKSFLLYFFIVTLTIIIFNIIKMDSLSGMPLSHHIRMSQERNLLVASNSWFGINEFIKNIFSYFNPYNIKLTETYPYVDFVIQPHSQDVYTGEMEPIISIINTGTTLIILCITGMFLKFNRINNIYKIIIIGSLFSFIPALLSIWRSYRYQLDFLPTLVLCANLGILYIIKNKKLFFLLIKFLLIVIFILNIIINLLVNERFIGEYSSNEGAENFKSAYNQKKYSSLASNDELLYAYLRNKNYNNTIYEYNGNFALNIENKKYNFNKLSGWEIADKKYFSFFLSGFNQVKPFIHPFAFFIPNNTELADVEKIMVFGTPRGSMQFDESKINNLSEIISKNTELLSNQRIIQTEASLNKLNYLGYSTEHPVEIKNIAKNTVFFSSIWSKSGVQSPFNGLMTGELFFLNGYPGYIYIFNKRISLQNLEADSKNLEKTRHELSAYVLSSMDSELAPTFIDLSSDNNKSPLLYGWWDPDDSGNRWTNGYSSLLLFYARNNQQLVLEGNTGMMDGVLNISINNKLLFSTNYKKDSELNLSLKIPDYVKKDTIIKVTLESNYWKPSTLSKSTNDQRSLGIYVKKIGFKL